MNLHAIVGPAISAINPPVAGTLYTYTGATKGQSYARTPTYAPPVPVSIQEQPLSSQNLRQLLTMNITNVTRKAYLFGNIQGVNRAEQLGGSILFFNGQYWLVTAVLEVFDQSGWCCVGLTEQVTPPAGI